MSGSGFDYWFELICKNKEKIHIFLLAINKLIYDFVHGIYMVV